ncbi:MAG: hypothetical protein FJW30_26095 [Acidobacteria bacterium]|nr:hypothetical protein [Acidobacteriota bacterium]
MYTVGVRETQNGNPGLDALVAAISQITKPAMFETLRDNSREILRRWRKSSDPVATLRSLAAPLCAAETESACD